MSNLSIRDTISGSVSIGEGSSKGIIKGSVSIGKGEQGPVGPVGPQGPIGDNNVCIGLSPTNEAEIWFDITDEDNTKEVATKEYIDSEIAKIDLSNYATKTELSNKADNEVIGGLNTEIDNINSSLDNLESEVNELKEGNIDIDLTNYATKTDLSKKLDKSELNGAINTALESAKNSGEFKGQDGHTPLKGVDYFTESDKSELLEALIQALPIWEGGSY